MKKLAIVLFLMSGASFSESIYCPPSLLCTHRGCGAIPDEFYISSSYILNIQYVFSEAAVIVGMASKCTYVNRVNKLILSAKKPLLPDQSLDSHQWFNLGGPTSGMYACQFNAIACPFTVSFP